MKTSWNLTLLYKNKTEWNNDYQKLKSNIDKLNNLKKDFINNKNDFQEFLKLKLFTDELVEKLYCYAKRHLDLDSTKDNYKIMVNNTLILYSELEVLGNYFETKIIDNDDKVVNYLKEKDLIKYTRYIDLISKRKKHLISKENTSFYKEFNDIDKNIKQKYNELLESKIKYSTLTIDNEEVVINKINYNKLIMNQNQLIRSQVFTAYTNSYKDLNKDITILYLDKLKNDIKKSSLEDYNSLLEKKLIELELPSNIISNLIKKVNENLDVMYKYINLKKRILNLDELHIYDSSVSVSSIPNVKISLSSSLNIIKESLNVLGKDYLNIIDTMFENGWVDTKIRPHKSPLSFTCTSYVGVPYISINYNNSLKSTRTLAHEIGHCCHTYYSKTNNEFAYYNFGFFITEIVSKVNEMLVNNYLLKTASSIEEKKYILNDIINSLGNSLFGQVMLTEFENTIINDLENNKKLTKKDLNNLYLSLIKKYNGPDLTIDEISKYNWSKIPHFVLQDSYYLYQYSIGTAISINIYSKLLNNENDMQAKYLKFLKVGNTLTLKDTLKLINIDLDNNDYLNSAFMVLNDLIESFKKLTI